MTANHLAFPILYRLTAKVAAERRERMTTEDFDRYVARFPRDSVHVVENKLSVMPEERRIALLRQLGV